jgi:hypothetical protein
MGVICFAVVRDPPKSHSIFTQVFPHCLLGTSVCFLGTSVCLLGTSVCMISGSCAITCVVTGLHKSSVLQAYAQPGAVQIACNLEQITKD